MVCKNLDECSLITPIGEMIMRICPKGLHQLCQFDYICDANFRAEEGQNVVLFGKECENFEVQKHVKDCIDWLNAYFHDIDRVTSMCMPHICVARECGSFQERVWIALAKNVGPGQTVTYGGLAMMVDISGASRAVGNAMAANPLQILVPCHRVIRSDGFIGQYAKGKKNSVKNWLLEHEGLKVVNSKVAV